MLPEREVILLFAPLNLQVGARFTNLTRQLSSQLLKHAWWKDECLRPEAVPNEVDRNWDWDNHQVEHPDGQSLLAADRIALVTSDGQTTAVQGAMVISSEPIESALQPGERCLKLELLATAPWNRSWLRKDGRSHLLGVGKQLLLCAVWLSRQKGLKGRLRLEGSAGSLEQYRKWGFQALPAESIVSFEGFDYTPMELSADAADDLSSLWPS